MADDRWPEELEQASLLLLGQTGSTYINRTNIYNDNWYAVYCYADAIFSELTDETRDGDTLEGDTFPAGSWIYGNFTRIQLRSGRIKAYKRG